MENKPRPAQDSQVMRVILFASAIIVFSIVLVSSVVYLLTERAAVNNLKSKDLVNIAESIASKIEGRVERAKETSLLLAKDPEVIQWVVSGEKDLEAGKHSLEKISRLTNDLHYSNSFIVSSVTNHYWTEQGEQIDTMSKSDPDDDWFFNTLNSGQEVSLVIDYNQERRDTFVFVNALMGRVERPLAITGVGLSLKDVAKELGDYKYGENSDLWLIDQQGNIYLSDNLNQNGKNIKEFIPQSVASQVIQEVPGNKAVSSLEYKNHQGELLDLISYPLQSTDWCLLFQIPRRESLSFLYTLKLNTLLAGFISLVAITFLFNFVSRNLANPYKRALELNQELENKVVERTKELFEKNQKLMDSIDYARRIQQSILPSQDKMSALYKDYFLLWRPRDLVGGDFYWSKKFGNDHLVAVGDCTGHGVPGALMTMVTVSILNQIADDNSKYDPALILKKLNQLIKQTLNQETKNSLTDDGVDIGLCYFNGNDRLIFAGAKTNLYVKSCQGLALVKGNQKSIGYVRTEKDYDYTNNVIEVNDDHLFYLTTDGYLDQNGGPKNFSLGKKQFAQVINQCYPQPLYQQGEVFLTELLNFMGDEPQRDDITVLAFKIS